MLGRYFEGWFLFAILSLLVLLLNGIAAGMEISGSEAARAAVRLTARASLCLFLCAFSASALLQCYPGNTTRWLHRNRRYVGLGFAFSHAVHVCAIITYACIDPVRFQAGLNFTNLVIDTIAYVVILLMALTSFRHIAALVPLTVWQGLHRFGSYYIWFAFAKPYFSRAVKSGFYLPFAILLLVALMLRGFAAHKQNAPHNRSDRI